MCCLKCSNMWTLQRNVCLVFSAYKYYPIMCVRWTLFMYDVPVWNIHHEPLRHWGTEHFSRLQLFYPTQYGIRNFDWNVWCACICCFYHRCTIMVLMVYVKRTSKHLRTMFEMFFIRKFLSKKNKISKCLPRQLNRLWVPELRRKITFPLRKMKHNRKWRTKIWKIYVSVWGEVSVSVKIIESIQKPCMTSICVSIKISWWKGTVKVFLFSYANLLFFSFSSVVLLLLFFLLSILFVRLFLLHFIIFVTFFLFGYALNLFCGAQECACTLPQMDIFVLWTEVIKSK